MSLKCSILHEYAVSYTHLDVYKRQVYIWAYRERETHKLRVHEERKQPDTKDICRIGEGLYSAALVHSKEQFKSIIIIWKTKQFRQTLWITFLNTNLFI